LRYNLEYHFKNPERKVHPSYLSSGDNAQNDDTKTQYADVTTTGASVKLWPWKKKKTGKRKTKNGPDGSGQNPLSGKRNSRLAERSVRQHLDNQVEVEVVEDENRFTVRLIVVFHSSSSLGTSYWYE
jgi:hypothetical protein